MTDKYIILHIEDVLADAEPVVRELRKKNIYFEHYIIDNEADYLKALDCYCPDIILCNYAIASFSASKAISIIKSKKSPIPFILIAAGLCQEVAMSVVSEGADGYILKNQLQRLPCVIRNAVEKYRFEKECRRVVDKTHKKKALKKGDAEQEIFKHLIDGSPVEMFEKRDRLRVGNMSSWKDGQFFRDFLLKNATGTKRLEKALESERQRFHELFLHAPCSLGMFKGPEHVFEMANSVYLQLTGRHDIIGKTVREAFPEVENQGLFDLLDYVYSTGNPFIANERLIKIDKDGNGELKDFYLNFVYQAYRNHNNDVEGIFFFAVDVTEQVQSRKKVEESEKRFRQIVEAAQEGIWMTDEDNKTVFVNQKMCDLIGYTEEEMMGRTNMFFKDEEGQLESLQRLNLKERRVNETHESKFITKSGKHIWTIVSTNPIFNEAGEYKGGLAMITDITTRKEQELQIQKNSREKEMLIAELTKSIRDLKQFTYITSHNFRAPLSNLMALSELLDYSTLTNSNKEVLEMFKASTLHLNKTINDLIDILIIKNNINVELTNNNMEELLSDVSNSLAWEINEAGCTITTDLQFKNIHFNKPYLESILLNLLSNSIKYRSEERPLEIDIATYSKTGGEVLLTIRDNGLGIDLSRHKDNIFGLYQRFHNNTEGAGLGLFMVKSQITALGGKIEVHSEIGKGTTFYVTFIEKHS